MLKLTPVAEILPFTFMKLNVEDKEILDTQADFIEVLEVTLKGKIVYIKTSIGTLEKNIVYAKYTYKPELPPLQLTSENKKFNEYNFKAYMEYIKRFKNGGEIGEDGIIYPSPRNIVKRKKLSTG